MLTGFCFSPNDFKYAASCEVSSGGVTLAFRGAAEPACPLNGILLFYTRPPGGCCFFIRDFVPGWDPTGQHSPLSALIPLNLRPNWADLGVDSVLFSRETPAQGLNCSR